jgi:DNA topoisomerase-3
VQEASHHAVIPNANTIDKLKDVWPRLSSDEKKLFDVIARTYLAALMPDYRYRQTVATLKLPQAPFRATGRQPLEAGWRAAFPDWTPASEKGDEAQNLPKMIQGEATALREPKIEAKLTRPPPRYNEGGLIEAMQNAWRFVEEGPLRDRLKEAKGIGTPATRAEVITGLKRQKFLTVKGKHIVPTDAGLELFGVLNNADPTLVDPGATAQLENLLDDVVAGKQEMIGAIDAVCAVADRIITKLKREAQCGDSPVLKHAAKDGGDLPPTPAMKRFAVSLARKKRLRLPQGYATSAAVCRTFLETHAPNKDKDGGAGGTGNSINKPPSPAQLSYAKNIAQADGIEIPDEARMTSAAMSS